jgi:hypothetical protein
MPGETMEENEVQEEETQETEQQQTEEETQEAEQQQTEEVATDQEAGDQGIVIELGEHKEEQAPEWVKDLRKRHRVMAKENRELKEQLERSRNPGQQQAIGARPKLEDYDYDTDKYEADLDTWYKNKSQADAQQAQLQAEQQRQQQAWQQKLNSYDSAKASLSTKLGINDFDEAEASVSDYINDVQRGLIVQYAADPAMVTYVLYKNPSKARELGEIYDPIDFALKMKELEKEVKMTKRTPPPPESTVHGNAPKSGAVDSTLDRLRKEAEQSGDYTKVHAYKMQKRKAARG